MKRLFSVLLLCALFLGLLPTLSLSPRAAETVDSGENIAAPLYSADTVYCSMTEAASSFSSSDAKRWNKFSGGSFASATDPFDESNIVTSATVAAKSVYLLKSVGFPTDTNKEFVMESSFMIAEPISGQSIDKLTVKMLSKTTATFLRQDASTYSYTIGSATGTVEVGTWMRLVVHVVPGTEGIVSSDSVVRSVLYGSFTDSAARAVSEYREDYSGISAAPQYRLDFTAPAESESGLLLDDLFIYTPGDFGAATITPETYEGDTNLNPVLNGKVHIKLYHRLDASRFDPAVLKLYDDSGRLVQAEILFNTMKPDVITLDFSSAPLAENTTYTLLFPENTIDVTGRQMQETELSFRTGGTEGALPERIEIVKTPSGGYVMPDRHNTGYRCSEDDLEDFRTKYPDFTGTGTVVISEELARKYNYEFSHFVLNDAAIHVSATSPVYIHDALLINSGIQNGTTLSTVRTHSSRLTVAWCEGDGGDTFFKGPNLTITHCYVHDVKSDHMKANAGQLVTHNYFRDGGTRSPGAHADVVQFQGSATSILDDVRFFGNRFDLPNLGYDHVANSTFFFSPESECVGYSNVQAIGNWFNGGVYTTHLVPENGASQGIYLTFRDNLYGYGHSAKKMSITGYSAEDLAATGSVDENNTYVTTLQAGSIVYYSADGTRVYDAADLSGSASVMVNLANYITAARQYRIEVRVTDADGHLVGMAYKEGDVRRYIPHSEYFTADNQEIIGTWTDAAGTHNIVQLKELPDLPSDVPETVSLTALPADMTDCCVEVLVYDITDGGSTLIRTGALADQVSENHRMSGAQSGDNGFAVTEAYYRSAWSGMTPSEVLNEGAVSWTSNASSAVTLSEDGVLTLTNLSRESISLPLSTLAAGAVRITFDLYRAGDGTDEQIKLTLGGRSLLTITPDGSVITGSARGTAFAGWNTVEVILLPYDAEGNLTTGTAVRRNEVYVRITPQNSTLPTYGITYAQLNSGMYLKNTEFATLAQYASVRDSAHIGADSADGTLRLANLTASNLTACSDFYALKACYSGEETFVYLPKHFTSHTYTLPSVKGADLWVVETLTATTVHPVGTTLTVSADMTLYGAAGSNAAFAGATMSLGGEMALNMKVDPTSLPAVPHALKVFADGSRYSGSAGAALDSMGNYNVTLSNVLASDMHIEMTLYILSETDGSYYIGTSPLTYSPLIYSLNTYNDHLDKDTYVTDLVVKMLYYGAAAEENRYGTRTLYERLAAEGFSAPQETIDSADYVSNAVTDADKAAINSIALTGATLTGGIHITFAMTNPAYTCLTVDGAAYYAEDGKIVFTGLHAASIKTVYTLTFSGEGVSDITANFSVGNFLESRRDNADETALAEATILYMLAARDYLLRT